MVLLIKTEALWCLRMTAYTEDGILLAFPLRCDDIAHSSSQLLPEAVSVAGGGCLTAIWRESWHHLVEGISQMEALWLPSQLVNTVASPLD